MLPLILSPPSAEGSDGKAPFRVLYSNDCTNVIACESPYHAKGQKWAPEMLEASVDETADRGIDVHMLQPAMTWVPWWPSKVYQMEEHYRWWKDRYGKNIFKLDIQEYILQGGDPVHLFVDRCHQKGLKPFVSLRLNDGHLLEQVDEPNFLRAAAHTISKFYAEHPEYRIGPDIDSWDEHVQNWAIPEVRDYKFKLIKEICENYEITGLELDFMRHFSYFQLDKTTPEQRKKIMAAFIRRVRLMLDKTSRDGEKRWHCVRIPCYLSMHEELGIDVVAMAEAGVDMFNLSASYFTVYDSDMAQITKMVPDRSVYLEMCHTVFGGKRIGASRYGSSPYRRTTPNQYYTAAHLAYSRGASGVSVFNFAYYRKYGQSEKERGPFHEPPFHIFQNLGDPDWVAQQPQHYVLARIGFARDKLRGKMDLHFNALKKKSLQTPSRIQTKTFQMDLAPTRGGWKTDGKLRIQANRDMADSDWIARVNGVELEPTSDVSEPYENPYTCMLGDATAHRAWVVPRSVLRDGVNNFELTMKYGPKTTIHFVDLAIQ